MVALKARANHYEVLGLKPTASDEEIAQAFARQMRLPHSVAELAQIGIAFDTLRTPAKRRSYDETLGLRPAPQPQATAAAMSFRISARLAALASPGPVAPPPAAEPLRTAVKDGDVQHTLGDARCPAAPPLRHGHGAGSSEDALPIAAAVHERETLRRRGAAAALHSPALEDILQVRGAATDEQPAGWPKSALALGSLLVAVVLIGAWAGAHAQDSDRSKKETSLAVRTPHPMVQPSATEESSTKAARPWAVPLETTPVHRSGSSRASVHTRPSQPRLASLSQSLESNVADAAPAQATADAADSQSAPDPSVAASLPLPRAVIASTIERIGYRCGEVASATAVEAAGVYKITCTSGEAYQAKPVRGRYHFKRW